MSKCECCGFTAPKIYNAETIKDAPEGRYYYRYWTGPWLLTTLDEAKRIITITGEAARFQAFGPIPQPDTTPNKEKT